MKLINRVNSLWSRPLGSFVSSSFHCASDNTCIYCPNMATHVCIE